MTAILLKFVWAGLQALLEFVLKPSNLVIAGILCVFVYGTGYFKGDAHRNRIWVAKITAERVAQEKTIKETTDRAIAETARLNVELEERDALINVLQIEAANDPNAGRPAIGTDGLRRINRGRAGGPK